MTGIKVGRLTVIQYAGTHPSSGAAWLCRCECGAEVVARGVEMRRGDKVSCGCYNKTQRTHGGGKHPLYQTWFKMWARCTDPSVLHSEHYLGRGILVCDRWKDPHAFYADMGSRPSPSHSLDRIDNDGNYEPNNCRWATKSEQGRNRRTTARVTYNGRTECIAEWGRIAGISEHAIASRLSAGWSVERALTQPVCK
jgi:hypothetical protein